MCNDQGEGEGKDRICEEKKLQFLIFLFKKKT